MHKKIAMIFASLTILLLNMQVKAEQPSDSLDLQIIPDEAIRLRILAHSNEPKDQHLKYLIRDQVREEISSWVEHLTSIEEARQLIQSRLGELQSMVEQIIEDSGETKEVNVEYGKKVIFPRKLYSNYLYPEGEYEAVLITIGAGQGDNWWCVLFPPLCFLDFSLDPTDEKNSTDEGEEEEPKVKFFLLEWLGWS